MALQFVATRVAYTFNALLNVLGGHACLGNLFL